MARQVGISQQALPLRDLILGPAQAIVQAQAQLSQSSVDFLSEVAFDATSGPPRPPEKGKPGEPSRPSEPAKTAPRLRMVEFSYEHPVPDPANPGEVIETPTLVRIPLLALTAPTTLSIEDGSVEFSVRVVGTRGEEPKPANGGTAVPHRGVTVYGVYAPKASEPGAQEPTLNFSITMRQSPLPEGMAGVLTLAQGALTAHPSRPKGSVKGA